jgi:hypothetical protein
MNQMNKNKMKKIIQQMVYIIECICCVPISIYWIYIEYINYKYLNQNTNLNSIISEEIFDQYI